MYGYECISMPRGGGFTGTLRTTLDPPMASIDVSSLYTNIPHEEGIQSALHFLSNHKESNKHPEQPNPEVLGELMNLVLKNNVFKFNEQFYLQIQGTAMGTKLKWHQHNCANLFMGKLEERLINLAPNHIHTRKRFIDDIFIMWTGTTAEFEKYMYTINQIHPQLNSLMK